MRLLDGRATGAWNFGPDTASFVTVGAVADHVATLLGQPTGYNLATGDQPDEAGLLALDSRKAQLRLGWTNRLPFAQALEWTVDWYRDAAHSGAREATQEQLRLFQDLGRD